MLNVLKKATCGRFTLSRRSIYLALNILFSVTYSVHGTHFTCKDFCLLKMIFFQKMKFHNRMWRKAWKLWKRKGCNICKTGTKELIAIQSNDKTFPLRSSLMKHVNDFRSKPWNTCYLKTYMKYKLNWNNFETIFRQ